MTKEDKIVSSKYDVLILNQDYSPYDIWTWQHAMSKFLCTDSVMAVYNTEGMVKYDRLIKDGSGNLYEQPAVLVLTKQQSAHSGKAPYTKQNIYARDMGHCQYCGDFVAPNHRTIDHVIPRAHWNPPRYHFRLSSFENIVTACDPCNKQKRNRTPQQANMTLIRKPRNISRVEAYHNKQAMKLNKPVQWAPYLNKVENVTQT